LKSKHKKAIYTLHGGATKILKSHHLYKALRAEVLLKESPPYWWPNAGTFEVVVGAILTQNTTWHNVEKSLKNLEGSLTLASFANLTPDTLKRAIKPSGFYNQKSQRLLTLSHHILADFQTFESFQKEVTREWLLAQKGIGPETADSILCYGCFREEMVVDTYTKRLLEQYGIVFGTYDDYKHYLEEGIRAYCHDNLALLFAQFHGMIVEYGKQKEQLPLQIEQRDAAPS